MTEEGSIDYLPWRAPEVEDSRERLPVDSEAARKLAWEQAYTDGYTIGIEAGTRDARQRMGYLHEILEALAKPFTDLDEAVSNQILSLVRSLTEQLVRREVAVDQTVIAKLLDKGLDALPIADSEVRIVVNPEDAAFIDEYLGDRKDVSWRVDTDATLTRGGCRIFSEFSGIDATVEARLNRIVESMLDAQTNSDADT